MQITTDELLAIFYRLSIAGGYHVRFYLGSKGVDFNDEDGRLFAQYLTETINRKMKNKAAKVAKIKAPK